MTRYVTLGEVLTIYEAVMTQSGGFTGIQNRAALEAAVAQPPLTFDHQDLYPSLAEKAAALGFALIQNHPFIDGNKRVGHAAMEVFLVLNGYELDAPIDEQEQVILDLAAGRMTRAALVEWVQHHMVSHPQG